MSRCASNERRAAIQGEMNQNIVIFPGDLINPTTDSLKERIVPPCVPSRRASVSDGQWFPDPPGAASIEATDFPQSVATSCAMSNFEQIVHQ
jgi:hypothetical protein